MKLKVLNNSERLVKKTKRKWRLREFPSVYFNSTTKTVIICKYMGHKSFQKVISIKDMVGWFSQ